MCDEAFLLVPDILTSPKHQCNMGFSGILKVVNVERVGFDTRRKIGHRICISLYDIFLINQPCHLHVIYAVIFECIVSVNVKPLAYTHTL